MAQQVPREPSVSELFQLSLAWSSLHSANSANAADFDDGFVFDIDPSLLVDNDKLTIGEIIGEGSNSIVYEGRYYGYPVAIKTIVPERTKEASTDCKARFQREFIGASVEPSMLIITELLEGGTLLKNMKRMSPMRLDFETCLSFALEISEAMEYLHANGIIHRDLKPSNLILTKDKKHVKLADFGIAREETDDDMTSETGTYRYMAPELYSKSPLPRGAKKSYDRKADVYSFAMVLWSLIKNETPFKDRKDLMAAYAAANNMRPSLDDFPASLVSLVQSCWEEDPTLRPEFAEITKILSTLLQICSSSTGSAPIAIIPEIKEGLDSSIDDQRLNIAQTSSPQSLENISKHDHNLGMVKRNGCKDDEDGPSSPRNAKSPTKADSAKSKPKKNNWRRKCLSIFKCCFGMEK
ncbi:hypothetical protein RIF29_37157 [Crotalaria pallida]|uniref:Protein kinase domain-containing protein n=1 Tax=Crotalaria pallida TaxID=3830 RepID=A0AAN9ECD8_CROPI